MTIHKDSMRNLLGKLSRSKFRFLQVENGTTKILAVQKDRLRRKTPSLAAIVGEQATIQPGMVPKPSIPARAFEAPAAQVVTPLSLRAPRVGHFSLKPEGATEPVLVAGAEVVKEQIIGFIESMSLKYAVKADRGGIIEETLVEDGEAVEYGQPLARLKEGPEAL